MSILMSTNAKPLQEPGGEIHTTKRKKLLFKKMVVPKFVVKKRGRNA